MNFELVDYKDVEVQKDVLIMYLQVMVAREDWHGVADAAMDIAAMDIRELEAEQKREP